MNLHIFGHLFDVNAV